MMDKQDVIERLVNAGVIDDEEARALQELAVSEILASYRTALGDAGDDSALLPLTAPSWVAALQTKEDHR